MSELRADATMEVFSTSLDIAEFLQLVECIKSQSAVALPAEAYGALTDIMSGTALEQEGVISLDPPGDMALSRSWFRYRTTDADTIDFWVYGELKLGEHFKKAYKKVIDESEETNTVVSVQKPLSKEERELRWAAKVARNQGDSAALIEELQAADARTQSGGRIESLEQVNAENFPQTIPILLRWLRTMQNIDLKIAIAMKLSLIADNSEVRQALFDEYGKLSLEESHAREMIGGAIARKTGDREFDVIAAHARNTSDPGRWTFLVALGKMRRHREEAIPILLDALQDPMAAYMAIESLVKLGATETLPAIRPFAQTTDSWKRNAAKRAIDKLQKIAQKQASGPSIEM